MVNIWESPEAEAWSRGFGYEDYVNICEKLDVDTNTIMTRRGYSYICDFFDSIQERNW